MNFSQLENILMIAEENNITHAAAKLYMTQSALNQQLLKLEKELGTELFYRSRTNWRPTKAGELYIAAAKEILQIKKNTYNQIYDLEKEKKGTLTIGFTPNRATNLFSSVYSEFHKKHPLITVNPIELSVNQQIQRLEDYALDIGFVTLQSDYKNNHLSYYQLTTEEIYLAVPASRDYSAVSYPHKSSKFPELSLSQLQNELFVLLYPQSTIRNLVDTLFSQNGYTPDILFETSSTYTILNMIQNNLCCSLIPAYYVNDEYSNISYYTLPERPSIQFAACYHHNNHLNSAAEDFIALVKKSIL